ncbi:modulator of FtsH protease [Gammaproteobacteria bacterium]
MRNNSYSISSAVPTSRISAINTNKLIRNTYMLLSMTLLFSAVVTGFAVVTRAPILPWWMVLLVSWGLLFLTNSLRNSATGLIAVFALTGFLGYTLGPIVGFYLRLPNGHQIVATAMGGTGVIFLGLSAYALTTRKDFSFMGGFLMVGLLVAILAGIGAILFQIPALSLAMSAMVVLLMSGFILYDTSAMIHGGEDNYIMATINLYLNIYNLFTSLLQISGFLGSDD